MPLQDYVELLPEDKREAFKKDLEAIKTVDKLTVEDFKVLLNQRDSPAKRAFDSEVSLLIDKHDKEKVPLLVKAEIEKQGKKEPWEIRIAELEAERAQERKQFALEKAKTIAVKKLADAGIDTELADLIINEDEAVTTANIEKLTGKFTASRDSALETELKKRFGNGKTPIGGVQNDQTTLEARLAQAEKSGNVAQQIMLRDQIASQAT
jgi:hypothetical protein